MRTSLGVLLFLPSIFAQSNKTPAADWPMFNRDLASTRYSPLSQITTANVAKLAQVWSYRLQPSNFRFATAGGAAEVVPLVVNGVMYISTQTRVVALNPEIGFTTAFLACTKPRGKKSGS